MSEVVAVELVAVPLDEVAPLCSEVSRFSSSALNWPAGLSGGGPDAWVAPPDCTFCPALVSPEDDVAELVCVDASSACKACRAEVFDVLDICNVDSC